MKKAIYTLLLISLFCGCSDDDELRFDVSMPQEGITFKPIPGGAIMYYELPANTDVQAINIRYTDALGQPMFRTGSYSCDSLEIVGFNEAQTDVPATVTLANRANVESAPIEVTFSTEDSGPVAFFDALEVRPSWNGFAIYYDVPEQVNGMAHVFYLGKSPINNEPDTILLSSFQIKEGGDTLTYPLQQVSPTNTVVIRTEDFRGYMVKEVVWENVESYNTTKLLADEFDFIDPNNLSQEDPEAKLGHAYLFDGDVKGELSYGLDKETFATYLAGPLATEKDLFILDFRKPRQIAQTKVYAMLNVRQNFPKPQTYWFDDPATKYSPAWNGVYMDKLPCELSVYVSNDMKDESSWKRIGHFEEDPATDFSSRWCNRTVNSYSDELKTMDDIRAAEPQCITLDFPATGESYRYMKIVVDEVFDYMFDTYIYPNTANWVSFHELEIYAQ